MKLASATRAAALMILSLARLEAAVVADTNILLSPGTGGGGITDADYALTVFEDEAGNDFTSIFFDVVGTSIQMVNTNIDAGSDWYLTRSGDPFTSENIIGGEFVHFFIIEGFQSNDLDVGLSPFFLGVNADDYTPGHLPAERRSFGWAHLQIVNGELTMLDNAVSYGEGIIIGTNTPIPEPGTPALVALATLACASRRRSRTLSASRRWRGAGETL